MTVPTQTLRTVAGIINSVETLEGAGFLVRRPFPKSSFSEFDPFLLLDELGPINLKPGQAKGAPAHPHRGFETVSYVLDGRLEHKKEYNAFAYVLDGSGLFGTEQERGDDGQMALFAQDGEEVALSNPADAQSPLA
ncbi:MAG: pirin family protein, partial [Microcystaceae cyanobacterium]